MLVGKRVGRGFTNSYISKFFKHQRTPKFFCYIAERLILGVDIPLFSSTRWSEKYKSIRILKTNFKVMLVALASLMGDASSEMRAKALFLKAALEKTWFNIRRKLDWAVLDAYGAKASDCWSQCIRSKKSMIVSLQSVFDQDRMDFTTLASSIYDEACAVVGTKKLSMRQVAARQVHHDNAEAESASQYYQRLIFLSYFDGPSSSLRECFYGNPSFFMLLFILPPNDPYNIDQIESLY